MAEKSAGNKDSIDIQKKKINIKEEDLTGDQIDELFEAFTLFDKVIIMILAQTFETIILIFQFKRTTTGQ